MTFGCRWMLPVVLACASITCAAQDTPMHNYPTNERVIFVQACMRDHPGGHYEMLNKCSCTIDSIAREVPFDDFTVMSTATNANSIGGERGSTIRDTEVLQVEIRKFRALTAKAKKSCFINLEAK
jgi:hypothetical protein